MPKSETFSHQFCQVTPRSCAPLTLFLLVFVQRHLDSLGLRREGQHHPPLHHEVDGVPRVAEDLDGSGVVHALERDRVGGNHPVIDHQLPLGGATLEHVGDGDAGVPVGEVWVVAAPRHGDSEPVARDPLQSHVVELPGDPLTSLKHEIYYEAFGLQMESNPN